MRKSNTIMLITIIVILFATAITSISIGIFFLNDNPDLIKFGKASSKKHRGEYTFQNFDSLHIAGFWNVDIQQADSYTISLTCPEHMVKYLDINITFFIITLFSLYFIFQIFEVISLNKISKKENILDGNVGSFNSI